MYLRLLLLFLSITHLVFSSEFEIHAPQGGSSYTACNPIDIKVYNRFTSTYYTYLQYSLDSGATWTDETGLIVLPAKDTTVFQWTPPQLSSTKCMVRVHRSGYFYDTSLEVFTINAYAPSSQITSPNGGESWDAFSPQNITWNSTTGSSNVKLLYSSNSGTSWTTIGTVPNTGSYAWDLPAAAASTYKIRLEDEAEVCEIDESDGDFSVNPVPYITIKNWSSSFFGHMSSNLYWTAEHLTSDKVHIELSTDSMKTWTTLDSNAITSSTTNNGVYVVKMPNDSSSTACFIRISDPGNPATFTLSNQFTIKKSFVELTGYAGGDTLIQCKSTTLNWKVTGAAGSYCDVLFSLDAGNSWDTLASNLRTDNYCGSCKPIYNWTVKPGPTTHGIVRIQYRLFPDMYVETAVFSITDVNKPTITINSLNQGETLQSGDQVYVHFTTNSTDYLMGYHSSDGGLTWKAVNPTTPNGNADSIYFNVPNVQSSKNLYVLTEYNSQCYSDTTDRFFTIDSVPLLRITSPTVSASKYGGESLRINWAGTNIQSGYVNLDYSIDGGANWISLADSIAVNDYYWGKFPYVSTQQFFVRVSDVADPAVYGVSPAPLEVKLPRFSLIGPNPKAQVGCEEIVLDYERIGASFTYYALSIDSGKTWSPLTLKSKTGYSWDSTGTLTFIPPNVAGEFAQIKAWNADSMIWATSEFFQLKQGIALNEFTGAPYDSDDTLDITWSTAGNAVYSTSIYGLDQNGKWSALSSSTSNTAHQFSWAMRSQTNSSVVLVITSNTNSCYTDTIDQPFAINPFPKVYFTTLTDSIYYGGDTKWVYAQPKNLSSDSLTLKLSVDSGLTWTTVNPKYLSKHQWVIPDTLAPHCFFLVHQYGNPSVADTSEQFSILKKHFYITGINQKDTRRGCSTVRIEINGKGGWGPGGYTWYSTDNGASWIRAEAESGLWANSNGLDWRIPPISSNNVRLKITDFYDANKFTVIDSVFTIHSTFPSVNLTYPTGGEYLNSGDTLTVTWTAAPEVDEIRIKLLGPNYSSYTTYSSNDGKQDIIIDPIVIPESFDVLLTDNKSCGADTSNTKVYRSTGPFVNVTYPAGGESLFAEFPIRIKWLSGNIGSGADYGDFKVYFSSDNGKNFSLIKTYQRLSCDWTLPNIESDSCLFKLETSHINNVPVIGYSKLFSIKKRSITVVYPNGGENHGNCETVYIKWDKIWPSGQTPILNFDYSSNNGQYWVPIEHNVSTRYLYSNGYAWKLPKVNCDPCLVRISDSNDPTIFDVNDAPFSIQSDFNSSISVNTPGVIKTFDQEIISWTSTTDVQKVTIQYSTDGKASWSTLYNGYTNTGQFSWTVPPVESSNCYFRILDAEGCAVGYSNRFTVVGQPHIEITEPNTYWYYAYYDQVFVGINAYYLPSDSVLLTFSADSGATWTPVGKTAIVNNKGSYYVDLSSIGVTDSYHCLIAIQSMSNSNLSDTSSVFAVVTPYMDIVSPNGGEQFYACDLIEISWHSSGISQYGLSFEFSSDGGSTWEDITNKLETTYYYDREYYRAPAVNSNDCRIRIWALGGMVAESAPFRISSQSESISVTLPSSNIQVKAGESLPLAWTNSAGVNTVSIYYYLPYDTANLVTVASSISNTGNYLWNLDSALKAQDIYVKIKDDAGCGYGSTPKITIQEQPYLRLLNPNGSEVFKAGEKYYLHWEYSGLAASQDEVDLFYSTNGGSSWKPVASGIRLSAINNYHYEWVVPQENSSNCLVKVVDGGNPNLYDQSDQLFTINNDNNDAIISPTTNDILVGGTQHVIKWDPNRFGSDVYISFSLDGGLSWEKIKVNENVDTSNYVAVNDGNYTWNVPSRVSSDCLIKLTPYNYGGGSSHTSRRFSISTVVSNDKVTESGLKLFPNPTTGIIHIEGLKKPEAYEIYDTRGRLFDFGITAGDINITSISPGVYHLKINGESKQLVKIPN